ncbi:MAG: sigma-70 family RNA polymerase sigma factor [Myxococcota bacterium]
MHRPSPTDDALLRAWGEGDKHAAAQLIDRYFDEVHGFFASKVPDEAEDLTQQTFLGCVERRDQLAAIHTFRAFLFAVARHRLIDHFRRKGSAPRLDATVTSLADLGTSPSRAVARDREQRVVLEGLRRIPLDSQLILELYYWQSLTGRELAEVLDVPEGTARSRLRIAKRQLTEEIERVNEAADSLHDTLTKLADWRPATKAATEAP